VGVTIWALANEFVAGGTLRFKHGIVHGDERALVNFYIFVAVFLSGFRFGEPDCADFGMGKHDGWDVFVRQLGGREFGASE